MTREIKFRAWDAEQNKMILTFDREYKIMVNSEDGTVFCGGNLPNGDWNEPPLMQYTGLKDKNGKEIYESDICKTYNIGEGYLIDMVIFDEGSFVFNNPKKLQIELRGFKTDYIEVIGNIYESPELLK